MQNELVTIAFSHYCEKARWALDRYDVPYVEHRYMPTLHFAAVLRRTWGRAGAADGASTRFSTPLLMTADGALLTDSCDIVAWVDRSYAEGALYPKPRAGEPEVAELERELGARLGPHTRRLAYFYLLPDPSLLARMADECVSARQAAAFRLLRRPATRLLRRALAITPAAAARSEERIWEYAETIAARLADGRPYLFGERFTAADLTFAAMMAPTLLPEQFGVYLPSIDDVPAEAGALMRRMREHPAGVFALRMFREERGGARRVLADRGARSRLRPAERAREV